MRLNQGIFGKGLMVAGCFSALSATAGDLEKAFKSLNVGDYSNAIVYFKEVIADDAGSVSANYGLGKAYAAKDFARYNLDSAIIFAYRASNAMPLKAEDKEAKKAMLFGVRDFTIKELNKFINDEAFAVAQGKNTADAYEHFANTYKDRDLVKKAMENLTSLEFEKVKRSNTVAGYKGFIETYPEAKENPQAVMLYEERLYKTATQDGTAEDYLQYMKQYPKGMYVNDAQAAYENLLYRDVTKKHTLAGYLEFEKKYPNHPEIGAVQDSIYELYTRDGRVETYLGFVQEHKGNRNIFKAWDEVYNLSTLNDKFEEYESFIAKYASFPNMPLAKQDMQRAGVAYKVAKRGDYYGYIDAKTGEELLPFKLAEANEFSGGLAVVSGTICDENCGYYYINKLGDTAINKTFSFAADFVNGRAVVGIGNCDEDSCKYGVIDRKGRYVIPPIYDEISDLSEGFYAAGIEDDYGFLDERGNIAFPFTYKYALGFKEGFAAVKTDSGWTFVNKENTQAIPRYFKDVRSFAANLSAATENDSTWGFIDHWGKWVIPAKYESAEDFENGFAIVTLKEKDKKNKSLFVSQRYKIDATGKVVEKLEAPKDASGKKNVRRKKK